MLSQRFSIIILLTILTMTVAAVVVTYGVLVGYKPLPNDGTVYIEGVDVFWDADETNRVTKIDWGYIKPGSIQNKTVYIKNLETYPVILNMTTSYWIPSSASTYIKLQWNKEGFKINGESMLETVLTLSVFSNITEISDFRFNMTIAGYKQ